MARFLITAAAGCLAIAAHSSAQTPPSTFCARLAPQLGMKPEVARSGSQVSWKVNTLGGLGPALFGGSTVVSFMLKPVEGTSAEQAQRFDQNCTQSKKGMLCRVEGPVRLAVSTKRGVASADATAGERAEVEMRGTSLHCRDG